MDRSSSSGSIGGITAPNTSPSGEEKVSEKAKNKNKQPAMVSKDNKKDAASKRAAYAQSKDSSQTKASQNLPRVQLEKSSSRYPASSSTSSSLVSSASTSSSESEEEIILPSTAPTWGASSSSSTTAASTSSTSAVNPSWNQFHQDILNNSGGVLFIGENRDVKTFCQWLASSPSGVHVLRFGGRSISNLDANYLTAALEKNTTIKHLQFERCDVDAEVLKPIVQALQVNKSITGFQLRSCRVGDDGAKQLAVFLKNNTTLQSLKLGFNHIGSVGAKAIAEALKANTTLTNLDISDNLIGDDGIKALAAALKVNTTLTSLNIIRTSFNDESAFDEINSVLKKNVQLWIEKEKEVENEGAKVALELINVELGKTVNPGYFKYPREVMDQVVDQMAQAGLRDEIIKLDQSIKPKT